MKIGELGKATGLNAKTIRFYEGQGLLPDPPLTSSGYRVYGPEDVKRLEFIRKAKRFGLSLEDISGVLLLHDLREPTCVHVRSLLDEKVAQVDKALFDLQEFRSDIVRLREAAGTLLDCRPSGGDICSIIESSGFQPPTSNLDWGEPRRGPGKGPGVNPLGGTRKLTSNRRYDLVIIGGGAAAFAACHLPLTLPLILGVLGGTGIGSFIGANTGLVYGLFTGYFIVGIGVGLFLLNRRKRRRSTRAGRRHVGV